MRNLLKENQLAVLLFLQIILIGTIFYRLFSNDFILADNIDGLKNYFTYLTYLQEDGAVWLQHSMNYPFGEYIFYTDNTPIFSMVIKFISTYIIDLYPYRFILFNGFFLGGILLSTWFCYLILKRLQIGFALILVSSLALPWLCPQVLKHTVGHFNLSLSWLFLLTFYGLIRLYETLPNQPLKAYKIAIGLIVLTILSGLIHLYYLPIIGILVGTFGVFWSIQHWQNKPFFFKILGVHALIPFMALITILGLIRSVDAYYALRSSEVDFNYIHFNFKLDALYSAYNFTSIPFPISTNLTLHSYGYLGGFVLFGGVFLLIWWISKKDRKRIWGTYFYNETGRLMLLLFGAGSMVLIISLGNYAKMFNNSLSFDNVFSPFYYLSEIVEQTKQFRVIARFSYPFFWVANFAIIYLIDRVWKRHKQSWFQYIAAGLMIIMVIEMTDFNQMYQRYTIKNTLHFNHFKTDIKALVSTIDRRKYTAILPLPFYIHGSEKPEYTFTPTPEWMSISYTFALGTGLPLMSSHLTRTAIEQHTQLLSLFEKTPDSKILEKLKGQTILILYSNADKYWSNIPLHENAKRLWEKGRDLPQRKGLKEIDRQGAFILYEWAF